MLTGNLGTMRLSHCTILPGIGKLTVNGANDEPIIRVERSICGMIDLPDR